MSKELEDEVRGIFDDLDRLDFEAIAARTAEDVQGVDELSRHWMRGRSDLTSYFEQMSPLLSDVSSSVSDIHANTWGDTALVTCWLEQSYKVEGRPDSLSAPTSFVFRREGDQWKVVLIHSVPLADQA